MTAGPLMRDHLFLSTAKDLKMAAGLILLLAKLPDVEIDILPSDHSPRTLES
jgi:hypothetical protein